MKKMRKRIAACLLAMLTIMSICVLPVSAASTRRCYTISKGNTTVYSDTGLSKKYGAIFDSDEVTVLDVTDRYCKVKYPISGGRTKTGYIPTGAILCGTTGDSYTARAKITTYRRPDGASYGYVDKGDKVTILGTCGNYTQVKYPVSGGYKYAFITTDNCNAYIKSGGNSGGGSTNLSYALYQNGNARITCRFDGYVNTKGRHEGIDISCGEGSSVYALADGVVVRVAKGSTGSKGLSTIAIYSSAYDKTIIYLHAAPSGISEGQNISKGQKIATESWRGISSSSSSHTHVEVRNGKQGYASKSVNDSTLDNSDPTSFWNSLGYNID